MKLDSKLTGTRLTPHKVHITWRDTTNFAAAIQEDNPVYFDDTGEKGLLAPPTFPVAVTWPILSNLGSYIQSRQFPKEVLLTQVHYTEHLILHRLVRPGDALELTGQIAAILPHRAGTHAVIELTATDKEGKPVFTEYIGAMLRGVKCTGDTDTNRLPPLPKLDPPGTPKWTCNRQIAPWLPYVYDGCSHIEFPIHTSPQFAEQVGLPGIILQGTATLALAVRALVSRETGGDPGQISEIACCFTGMVRPGTAIDINCLGYKEHRHHRDLFFNVLNADNQQAIRSGYLKIKKESA
jgi:N-terminal half of MaoC dehydratase/MaoC like domain